MWLAETGDVVRGDWRCGSLRLEMWFAETGDVA